MTAEAPRKSINEYYHAARPHQGSNGDTPIASAKPEPIEGPSRLVLCPVCGGRHHRYERVAAAGGGRSIPVNGSCFRPCTVCVFRLS